MRHRPGSPGAWEMCKEVLLEQPLRVTFGWVVVGGNRATAMVVVGAVAILADKRTGSLKRFRKRLKGRGTQATQCSKRIL